MRRSLSRKNLWETSPRWIKKSVGAFLGRLPPDVILGKNFRDQARFVRKVDQLSISQTKSYQLQRLRTLLQHAYQKTVYYREHFDKAKFRPDNFRSLEEMAELPFIDKNTVVENLDRMMTVPKSARGIDYVATGGSSGTQLRFYINADRSYTEYAYLTASWERVGYQLNLPLAVLRGQIIPPDRDGLRHEYDPLLRRHYYSNFHMDEINIKRYIQHLETIGPCFLLVYPSSAFALAQFLRKTGMPLRANIKGILAGSENVYPTEREYIEETFGCRLFSWYGHSEKLVMAAECEHSADYHVWPTYGYCEIIGDDGLPITTPGQKGEIVGTGFLNSVTPFIRYLTGDYAEYVGDRCDACGRETMILRNIEGRWPQGDLVGKNGGLISMTTINVHDDTFDMIRDYQFHQSVAGEAILSVVPLEDLTATDRTRIIDSMNKRLQGQISLQLEVRPELVKTERGKTLRVVQKIPRLDNTVDNEGAE